MSDLESDWSNVMSSRENILRYFPRYNNGSNHNKTKQKSINKKRTKKIAEIMNPFHLSNEDALVPSFDFGIFEGGMLLIRFKCYCFLLLFFCEK